MGTSANWLARLIRFVLLLAAAVAVIVISSGIAVYVVSRQMRLAIENAANERVSTNHSPEGTISIDFYEASGIAQDELRAFLVELGIEDQAAVYPMIITLQNAEGEFLTGATVLVQWESGSQPIRVGKSGVLLLPASLDKLPGLRLLGPPGYDRLKQRSIPLGTAYEPEEALRDSGIAYDVVSDSRIESAVTLELWRMKASGDVLAPERLQKQLKRPHASVTLAAPGGDEMPPVDIYRQRKRSVVIVATLLADGTVVKASGVVLHPSGVVATAYHVLDKPDAVARGVMTFDEQVYPIAEVLAADRPTDLALVKIEAAGLTAAPLSEGDPEGSPVTIISHPGGEYYTLTRGVIGRYLAMTQYGRVVLEMSVTADFADGSSGGPVFNQFGAVTGIVSATRPLGNQMVTHLAVPAECIRALIQTPADNGESL